MVKITKTEKETTFEIIGLHKLWAFKSEIKIPNDHIINAYQDETKIKDWYMAKLIGTNMPYVLNAGTFYQDGGKIFMDVAKKEKAIIIELKDENYKQLIIEVEDPLESINVINKK
jgi:hypothetical protein